MLNLHSEPRNGGGRIKIVSKKDWKFLLCLASYSGLVVACCIFKADWIPPVFMLY